MVASQVCLNVTTRCSYEYYVCLSWFDYVTAWCGSSQDPHFTLAHHRVSSSSVVEHPTRSRRVVGSNTIWNSEFFFPSFSVNAKFTMLYSSERLICFFVGIFTFRPLKLHAIPRFFSGIICCPSWAVICGHGIICGPIWGSFAVGIICGLGIICGAVRLSEIFKKRERERKRSC